MRWSSATTKWVLLLHRASHTPAQKPNKIASSALTPSYPEIVLAKMPLRHSPSHVASHDQGNGILPTWNKCQTFVNHPGLDGSPVVCVQGVARGPPLPVWVVRHVRRGAIGPGANQSPVSNLSDKKKRPGIPGDVRHVTLGRTGPLKDELNTQYKYIYACIPFP